MLFTTALIASSPYYFLRLNKRGNWRPGFGERFGRYDSKLKQAITNRHTLWMHAVSVGEVNLCTHLIAALEARLPNLKILVSTTTTTGMGRLRDLLPSHVSKIYYPLDRRQYVTRALAVTSPEAIVLVEAELWPNFLWRARELRLPTFLVNARLSDRSFRGYKRFGFIFRPLFESMTAVGAQDETDAARLRQLGCRPEAVHVVGSLKFDAAALEERRLLDVPAMLRQLGVPHNALLLVCGSTHAGEESLLAEIFLGLRARHPSLFLILVPRHFERGREVGRELTARGVKFVYRSEIGAYTQYPAGEVDCLLVNTTGELKQFYQHADIIFVGKSLAGEGGQNPIEPAALGKPVVFGPNMQNFAAIARTFVEQNGAVQIPDGTELARVLDELLADKSRREMLGRNAVKVVHDNLGAVERTVEMIVKHLEGGEMYIAPRKGL